MKDWTNIPKAPEMWEALRAIEKALREDAESEYHTAREFLDRRDIYHDDLDGERVLLRVAQVALGTYEGK